ncbi:PhnD/SsuA/transferrin family substrate-binding protein [Hyalangium rubrum]|uniref:histidine kinase n=1 Tax=Hyalangium rubrum TaxID=3103134 RepID=A0ABU5H2R7_9BACT|nr:PhnD/SsuA/transferrin family substrate-binding protein [Hyalangium sp. s54d21]MDY7227067.1 PhnD/SsuA/transferrin family substrate-binding protein [Hyalangium sp. s54d21]
MTSSPSPIRFVVYPSLGEVREHVRVELLGHAISLRMGRAVQVTTAPSYEALSQALEENRVDIAWGTAEQCARFGPRAWAVLRAVRFGHGHYHAALVCRSDDSLTLESLRGRRAAWVSPESMGGYLLIARHLEALGSPPAALFAEERFIGSYGGALRAVVSGEADVTSVLTSQPDEITARAFMGTHLGGGEHLLKPLLFSGPTPADGLILTRRLSREDAAALSACIVELSKGGAGMEPMIAAFHSEGFTPPADVLESTSKPWSHRGTNFVALRLDEEDRCREVWAEEDRALGRDVRGREGQTLAEVLGPHAAARLQALTRLTRHNRKGGRVKYHLQEAPGETRSYAAEMTWCPPSSEQSRPAVLLQLQDVTELSPLEEHLFRLASFPLMHPEPMLELDMAGALRYANPAAHERFPDLLAQGRNHPVVATAFAWALSGEEALPATVHLENRDWELAVVPLPDTGVLRVFAQDITARRQMERQEAKWSQELRTKNDALATALSKLREAQDRLILQERLAALGTLTAGIAHELRNPLNFVNSFSVLSEDLLREVTEELAAQGSIPAHLQESLADVAANVRRIKEHGHRMERIIRAMLEHSSGNKGERRDIALNVLLADSINLVYHGMWSRTPSFNIQFEQEFDEAVGKMQLVPQEISRVITNLLENACHAVHAKRQTLGGSFQGRIQVKTKSLPDSVEIHLHDNGTGIPQGIRDKLFTPFFTTKPAGEGTGLGLSISHEIIVKGYGGDMRFESEEGAFTTFIITLPRQRSEPPRPAGAPGEGRR